MKFPTLAFASLWAAMILFHGHFFLVKTLASFPILDTISSISPSNHSAPVLIGNTASLLPADPPPHHPPAWYSILSSPHFLHDLQVFALNYTYAVLAKSYQDFRKGGKVKIVKHMRECSRVPLRSLAAAYVLEYLVREVVLFAMAGSLDGYLGLRTREEVRGPLKMVVRF